MARVIDHNLIVISDLHLGEDLRPGGTGVSYLRHLVRLEKELEKFLHHHTDVWLDERPWRLVINGDMVDFMSMNILPEEGDADTSSDDDRLYGLGWSERAAQKKLERVIVRHQGVFRALGEFVLAGNQLVVVVGNHDVEFHYESVQRTFVEWLCGLTVGAGANEDERAPVAGRVQFCPWFYYEKDQIYIEHGHQFDEYCSFDYQLRPAASYHYDAAPTAAEPAPTATEMDTPVRGGKKSRFALSMAHAGMRYFANQLPEYDPHTAETWGFVHYFRWVRGLGLRGFARISYLYGLLVWKVVEAWYAMRGADGERKAAHLDRLSALSLHFRMTEDQLVALSALHRVPVTSTFLGVLRALFIDRLLLSCVAVGTAAGLALGLTGLPRVLAPVALLAVSFLANDQLGRARLESCAQKLRAVPRMVQALVGVPLIVFGHSHAPEQVPLPGGSVYFNTGTWASDDTSVAFTHLVVLHEGGQKRAELRQWRDGSSVTFTNTVAFIETGTAKKA